MREIKFRAWDVRDKKWLYGDMIHATKGNLYCKHINNSNQETYTLVNDFMQFTGLTDRHGKEIYEGDIIRFDSDGYGEDKIMAVEYDEQHTGFNPFCDQIFRAADSYSEWSINSAEVIGNIYENPELVK